MGHLKIFNLFLISIFFLLLSNCKGGKVPVSGIVEQPAQLTGQIEGADLTGGGPFPVTLVDSNGNEVAAFETAGDGSFTETLPEGISDGDFILVVKRGEEMPLEKIVRVARGKMTEVEISNISTLIAFLSRALFSVEADSDNVNGLEVFIRQRFTEADLQAAIAELRGEIKGNVVVQMLQSIIRNYDPVSVD